MGLLLTHKSTVLTIFPDMVSLSEIGRPHAGGGKRNVIAGFSAQSRYRIFRLLHSIQFSRITFVTLTYGRTFPTNGKRAKDDLRRFRRATERRYGSLRAVWRLELQQREAPHFHILYFDAPFIPVKDWEIVWEDAHYCPKDERFGNSLDLKINAEAKGSDVVGKYVGKYVAKPTYNEQETTLENQGRVWGRWNIEEPKPQSIELYDYEAKAISKILLPDNSMGGFTPLEKERYTVFGDQMGSDKFRTQVLRKLEGVFKKTRKLERGRVSIDA